MFCTWTQHQNTGESSDSYPSTHSLMLHQLSLWALPIYLHALWSYHYGNLGLVTYFGVKVTFSSCSISFLPGRVAQSVTCLATDACLTADPGVASSIPVRSHTFVEIDHEIISTVILLPSADSFKKGCCQLQAKVCARITG